tara:strand:- start:845 stop:958 length:114 start_codon:yes stop_codon:yes gene_type:complete
MKHECGWFLVADDKSKVVVCKNPECMIDGKYKQVKPR